jgi:beta-glucosidase
LLTSALLAALALIALALAAPAPGKGRAPGRARGAGPIYRNPAYPPAERAVDLVSRMTLAEKASQMITSASPAIPRLGVRAYGWWNEAAHGVSRLQLNPSGATSALRNTMSYPVDQALGTTWDPGLIYREASAISDEAREVVPGNSTDLDFFTPTVNLARDPRWGRNEETFSEDPLLTAALASQFVDGMEGRDQNGRLLRQGGGYLKTIATLKHFAANNVEAGRLNADSVMDERTLREYYTAQFRQIVQQSHPGAMMSPHNSVNGTPAAANGHLIGTLARRTFGFGGYFSSDCAAIDGIALYHQWQPRSWGRAVNEVEAHALANAAGEDLNCNVGYNQGFTFDYQNSLPSAVGQGIPTQTDTYNVGDLDSSLVRLFTARIMLGEFGRTSAEPWVRAARARLGHRPWTNSDANNALTQTPARLDLARQVAEHALVLLKNVDTTRKDGSTGKVLPLSVPRSGPFRVALIGFVANPPYMELGGYASIQGGPGQANEVTPYAGLKRAVQAINPDATVDYYNGFNSAGSAAGLNTIDQSAVDAAANYDEVIAYVGTDGSTGNEIWDRADTALPGPQAQLVNELAAKNPNTVAVIESAGPVDVGSFEPNIPAMLWSSYNGQRKGDALADVLLGRYDPSGHLPFTWYQSAGQLPGIGDYRIRPGTGTPGRTYMYFRGPVSYPFGYGLSYASFRDSNLRVDRSSLGANDTFHVSVDVTNTSPVWGSHLVQLYIQSPGAPASPQRPVQRLEGFRQVWLGPGQTRTVTLTVSVPDLAYYNPVLGRYTVDDGRYWLLISNSAGPADTQLQRPVSVSGKLLPVPSTVSASPTMPGDAARGIQSRVMFPEDTVVLPNVTVAMNDQSLVRAANVAGAGDVAGVARRRVRPPKMSVHFASDRPGVAAVARNGTIRTLSPGVATITATATYRGVSKSTQFVVRVLSELDDLAVRVPGRTSAGRRQATRPGGRRAGVVAVPGFEPDTFSYEVIVPDRAKVPQISAHSPDPLARVRIAQTGSVPGTATVRVTGPDGMTSTYKVYFARHARSDEFAGGVLGPQWSWIRHDPAREFFSRGALVIAPRQGAGDINGVRNILVQPAVGNWTVQAKLTFSAPPSAEGQQAGIIAYQGDHDYLKLDWEYSSGAARLSESTENTLSGSPVTQLLTTVPTAGRMGSTVWLRLVKHGPRYTAYYSGDGAHFARLYNTGASLANLKLGVFASGGAGGAGQPSVAFDYVRVRNTGVTLGPTS